MENLYAGIVFGCRYRTFLCHGFCSPAVAKTRAKPGLIAQAEKSAQVVVMQTLNACMHTVLSIELNIIL
jgi:hypothetical protein